MGITLTVGLASVLAASSVPNARTWTDNTGQYKTEAEFLDLKDGVVWLTKPNGDVVRVPLERLSEADQRFINREKRSAESFAIGISWKTVPAKSQTISEAPDIVYRKRQGAAISEAQIVTEVDVLRPKVGGRESETGTIRRTDGTPRVEYGLLPRAHQAARLATAQIRRVANIPLTDVGGEITNKEWTLGARLFFLFHKSMLLTLDDVAGKTELRVALFRVPSSDTKGQRKAKDQLSNWLVIPVNAQE